MENKKLVLLAAEGDSTNIVYHALSSRFHIHLVVIEGKESKKVFLKRRIKKLGILKVIGQVLFQLTAAKILSVFSKKRVQHILSQNELHTHDIDAVKVVRVDSVNDESVQQLLRSINPDAIVVNGTRIISKRILTAVNCPFINMHAGITPMYRGVHGGYWSLVNNDAAHCGVTVHLVDAGIDTGNILYQANISPEKEDNFSTYPYLQTAKGIELLKKAAGDALDNTLRSVAPVKGESKLWYHPTLWQYLYFRMFKKVK